MYWCVLDNNLGVFCCYSCHLVMSDSLQPHELLDARLSCLSPSSEICPSSCLLHPAISSSDALFSFCPQSFPASGTSPMSRLLASDDQNTGASASASASANNIGVWGRMNSWIYMAESLFCPLQTIITTLLIGYTPI